MFSRAVENRGFASLSPERRREIARLGGLKSRGGGRKPKQITHQTDSVHQTKEPEE